MCLVHYRVGDMLSLMGNTTFSAIDPRSVAAAVASFRPLPTAVEVVGGGVDWLSPSSVDQSPSSVASRSRRALGALLQALRDALPPTTRIGGPPDRPADDDFWRLAQSPMLVLGAGSFGLAAALAGRPGQQVRSPACGHLLDVVNTRRAPRHERWRPGWREYAFDVVRF